jgi:hypothetical protein
MGGPVNIWLRPDGPPSAELHRIGVARSSLAAARQRHTATQVAALATSLLAGDDTWLRT